MAKNIYFFEEDFSVNLKNKIKIKQWLSKIVESEGFKIDCINFIFCSDNYLLDVNLKYLNHNTLTDIITFQYSQKNEPILSDIYISIERCQENAANIHIEFIIELYRLLAHGVLHLCGYKDKKPADKIQMTQKEDYYLSLLTF